VDDSLPDLSRRFGGIDRLYFASGAQRLRAAHVAVVGIGGVGSWAAEALARTGLGRLTLIDLDHVAESNVNRQIHATSDTLGMAKIAAMEQRIASINPACQVNSIDAFVEPGNWPAILPPGVDGVIDACDQMRAKVAMAAWALAQRHILFITVGAAGGKRRPEALDIADLSACVHDPLMAELRYQLRRHHGAAKDGKRIGLSCVYSSEPMALPTVAEEDAESARRVDAGLNCRGYGSVVTVTATCGMLAAGWMLNNLSGVGK
jgi:tRNA A37 threonylcarbamoyladenosine dehydratase